MVSVISCEGSPVSACEWERKSVGRGCVLLKFPSSYLWWGLGGRNGGNGVH